MLLTILWIYRVGKVIVPWFSIELSKNVCWAYFSPNYLTWLITSPETCGSSFDGTIMAALQIFGLTTVFNVATFSKVLYFYRVRCFDLSSSCITNFSINLSRMQFQDVRKGRTFFYSSKLSSKIFYMSLTSRTLFILGEIH